MDFLLVILYAIVNMGIWIYCLKAQKSLFTPGMVVLSFYLIVAIFGVPAYIIMPLDADFGRYDFSDISLWPYIYYLLASFFLIGPIMLYKISLSHTELVVSPQRIKYFTYFFIFCGLLSSIIFSRTLIQSAVLSNLKETRHDLYEGFLPPVYNNQFEHIIILISLYFCTPARIVLFFLLTHTGRKIRIPVIILFLYAIAALLPQIMDAMRTASRGMIISIFFEIIIIYLFFAKNIVKRIKICLFSSALIMVALLLAYTIAVTFARFGVNSDDSAYSSLISYFGQPTIIFNSQVVKIEDFAYGMRFFCPLYEAAGIDAPTIIQKIGWEYEPCFSTLVGDIWIDVGPAFTLVICIAIGFLMVHFQQSKKTITVAGLYLLLFYALFIIKGALVTAYGECINIFACLVTAMVVYFMFTPIKGERSIKLKM